MAVSSDKNDCIRIMVLDDLERVLTWRNHPDVRRFMYTQHQIVPAEHQRWFEQATRNPHKHLLIFEADGTPLGFVNISQLDDSLIANWGFYTVPDAPKGTGLRLGRAALNYAFGVLQLHKVCGQALGYNERSISFHHSLGFQQEGLLRDQHFDGQHYHDVLCFGLLASERQMSI